MPKLFATTTIAALTMAGAALAQTAATSAPTTATAATDLNLRSGPQSTAPILGVIANGDEVSVAGCIESANWCEVTYDGQQGWAYGDYLTARVGEEPQPLYENRQAVGVAVIEAPARNPVEGQNTAVGAAGGAAMGAVVGGPVGALVGAALGGTAGNVATPEPAPEVRTYITANPQQPVILDGEVVLGAGIPESVTLYEIPGQSDYRYVVVNDLPVLVNDERRIVYVYR
ncbi:DUF1236 domain-containing protein [Paracoccus sp. (in: a-proteobacteria)]|uniref:DUF1236 domain-containing protein n=1 Tax=Paracoccus sp. TaxID=267 RepID=UPI0026E0B276|nr:DUF1236 domain-containing protein [Paracoccus sp. (in: a-proteobacteria)]MDO5369044.1 DUF1236 domain-containing protein [Paracoccus sp. (in: a-proteobacteria)]